MSFLSEQPANIMDINSIKKLPFLGEKILLIPIDVARTTQAVIIGIEKKKLILLTTNNFPEQLRILRDELFQQGYTTELYFTGRDGFQHILSWYDRLDTIEKERSLEASTRAKAQGTAALMMIDQLFAKKHEYDANTFVMELVRLCYQAGASDLHFQSERDGVFVKVRIDGILHQVIGFTHQEFGQYLAKIKFLSGIKMNITKMPQDGRFSIETQVHGSAETVDVRVNTLPGLYFDGVVMRFLETALALDSFDELGFFPYHIAMIEYFLNKKHGMIFVTGPTGSGKTTTLYTMLDSINSGELKIITLEDPVEYQLAGIQQSQIHDEDGYSYEEGLKAVLRHDPDIILVGETRSLDTADTIVNAALTGHLVLTSVHTNSALETISRLISMGVKTYLLAPAIQMICAQRLLRKVCPHCVSFSTPSEEENKELTDYFDRLDSSRLETLWKGQLAHSVGCDACSMTGYKGRLGVFELLTIDERLKTMIIDQTPFDDMYRYVLSEGFVTLFDDGMYKMLEGLTTLEEVRKLL